MVGGLYIICDPPKIYVKGNDTGYIRVLIPEKLSLPTNSEPVVFMFSNNKRKFRDITDIDSSKFSISEKLYNFLYYLHNKEVSMVDKKLIILLGIFGVRDEVLHYFYTHILTGKNL